LRVETRELIGNIQLMLTVCSRTHPGSVRTINEDVAFSDPNLGLLVVADGMGGHNAGEVASRLAVESLRSFMAQSADGGGAGWPLGFDHALSPAANRLKTAVRIANMRVHRASAERPDYNGMGTTIVAASVNASHVAYAGVGDSRIYAWRDARLEQLTADDSWIAMLQQEGLPPRQLERHPMRHVLTNVIGARADVDVKVREFTLTDGETLVLCTDGLHGAVPDSLIASTLNGQPDLEHAADTLVQTAVARDGSDNVTILLARYSG
jgi:serine/threonine protein phosphatase PrpC